LPHAPRRNRVKLIRYRRLTDSIPRKSRFQVGARERRVLPHPLNAFRSRKMSGFHHLLRVFGPGWASVAGETPVVAVRPHAMSLVRCLYNRCEIARWGFGGLAFDSIRERCAGWVQTACCGAHSSSGKSIENIRKYQIETMSCKETSITNACYLCNTLRKRGGPKPLDAVP
jgi:hypothetical protein